MGADEFESALAGASGGDEESFAVLWRMFNPSLRRVATAMAGHDDADDITSVVWVDVLRSIGSFTGTEDQFRAWLHTIARRRLIDLRRKEQRRPHDPLDRHEDRPGPSVDPATWVETAAGTDAALRLIASLPPDQAEVVLLRVVAGLDVAAVASIVGKRPGNVRVLAHRGLRALAAELAGRGDPAVDAGSDVTP